MILKSNIITDIEVNSISDLYKLKPFMEDSTLKINKSYIARELGIDRRTVNKYINGFTKSKHRKSKNCIEPYYDIIKDLLKDGNVQVFSDNDYYPGSTSSKVLPQADQDETKEILIKSQVPENTVNNQLGNRKARKIINFLRHAANQSDYAGFNAN